MPPACRTPGSARENCAGHSHTSRTRHERGAAASAAAERQERQGERRREQQYEKPVRHPPCPVRNGRAADAPHTAAPHEDRAKPESTPPRVLRKLEGVSIVA